MAVDDFNPNAVASVERCCPECGFDPDDQRRLEKALKEVLQTRGKPMPEEFVDGGASYRLALEVWEKAERILRGESR